MFSGRITSAITINGGITSNNIFSGRITYDITINGGITSNNILSGSKRLQLCTGTKTFAKEPRFAKLLRGLKSTPVSYKKKVHWFFTHVCNCKFAVLWVLCCGITCKWVLMGQLFAFDMCLLRHSFYTLGCTISCDTCK